MVNKEGMALITYKDFETKNGRDKIVRAIHALEQKVHVLEEHMHALKEREDLLEREAGGYGPVEP